MFTKSLLIIEDDAGLADLIHERVSDLVDSWAHVSSGKAALEWLSRDHFEGLILLDFSLPDMNGEKLIEKIRLQSPKPFSFIVTTGAGDERLAVRMMKEGARDYLIKDSGFLNLLPKVITRVLREMETEQQLAEAQSALLESEKVFRDLFDHSPDPCLLIEGDRFMECNNAAAGIMNFRSKQEILATHPSALSPETQPDGRPSKEKANEMMNIAFQKGVHRFEWLHRRATGELFPVEVTLAHMILRGKPMLYCIWRDLTEQKKAEDERRRLEAQVLHTQKLESLGVLAGGIAHDFNNLLMAILGNVDLALLTLPPDSRAKDRLLAAIKASQRAADLCKQMLAYSGRGKFLVEQIRLNHLIREMGDMLEVSISKKSSLSYHFFDPLPRIDADATQIRQVVMNLIINASEALGENSGSIAVSTQVMECDQEYLKNAWARQDLKAGTFVILEVTDSGCGMDPETLSKIFDPFFSTKFTGRGLGLAAVLGIVRSHGGTLKVFSEKNKGTTFRVHFPVSASLLDSSEASKATVAMWKGAGTILLVDDEEPIRLLGTRILEHLGFQAVTAADGPEAIELFKKDPAAFQCVILDMTMPKLDGEATFRELIKIRKDVRVIMSSGFSEQEISGRFEDNTIAGFIQKPYRVSALARILQKAIG